LRHREHIAAQVKRNKYPAEDQQYKASEPLKMSDGESRGGAGSGKSDKMFRGNVRYKQRSPDEKPADIAAGQEIFLRGAFPSRKIEPDAKNDQKVNADNDQIDRG
jgi:hypothetical protein